MANSFLGMTNQALALHGKQAQYTRTTAGVYDIETGAATNTTLVTNVQVYKKHIKTSQYNYPNLIGKDAVIFYLANNALTFIPKARDKITYDNVQYTVDSFVEHVALGETVLYKILAIRG